jgi:hypothetical protein
MCRNRQSWSSSSPDRIGARRDFFLTGRTIATWHWRPYVGYATIPKQIEKLSSPIEAPGEHRMEALKSASCVTFA